MSYPGPTPKYAVDPDPAYRRPEACYPARDGYPVVAPAGVPPRPLYDREYAQLPLIYDAGFHIFVLAPDEPESWKPYRDYLDRCINGSIVPLRRHPMQWDPAKGVYSVVCEWATPYRTETSGATPR